MPLILQPADGLTRPHAGHGYSADGKQWRWIGGGAGAPYNFTTPKQDGGRWVYGTVFFKRGLIVYVYVYVYVHVQQNPNSFIRTDYDCYS